MEPETALTTLNHLKSDEPKPPTSLIPRAITRVAIRVAIACLTLCMRLQRSPEPIPQNRDSASSPSEADMAVIAVNHQISCQCHACMLEVIITDLRVEHLFRDRPCDGDDADDWRWSTSVCKPFTSIEIALLDTNDEELIRLAFPALASLIQEEIDARYESDFDYRHWGRERPRGTYCVNATRH